MVLVSSSKEQLRDTNQNQNQQQQEQEKTKKVIIPSWVIGLVIRCTIAYSIPKLMDHTNVPYTDIDYHVFTDSIQYIQNGYSPYNRITYRYTPLLASILSLLPYQRIVTRYIFCIADTICGYIILKIRQQQRNQHEHQQQQHEQEQHNDECINKQQDTTTTTTTTNDHQLHTTKSLSLSLSSVLFSSVLFQYIQNLYNNNNFIDAVWWLYNPLPINICTRGSAESLIVLLPVLITTWILLSLSTMTSSISSSSTRALSTTKIYVTTIIAGICHGISIHAKLYPIIYTLSYATYLFVTIEQQKQVSSNSIRSLTWNYQRQQYPQSSFLILLIRWIYNWMLKLLQSPIVWIFGIVTVSTFIGITYLSYTMYGDIAIQEGLLYHFSRVDHRHNYSIHWYWIYLVRYIQENQYQYQYQQQQSTSTIEDEEQQSLLLFNIISMTLISRLLVIPQIIILLISSLHLASYSLTVALFVQTFVFVIQNKVITAQYFTWYLCFLPLCTNTLFMSNTTSAINNTTTTTSTISKKIINVSYSVLIVLVSIVIWLLSAYCLEMLGMAVHTYVWIASILYYLANINLLRSLLVQSSSSSSSTPTAIPSQPVLGIKNNPDNDATLKKQQ